MFRVKVDTSGLARVLKTIPEIGAFMAEDFVKRAGIFIHRQAKRYVRVDTGRLKADIHVNTNLAGIHSSTIVGTDLPYAIPLEYGTKPHFPPPRALEGWVRRRGISAKMAGKKRKAGTSADEDKRAAFVIARSISMKGTQPHPFLGPAKEDFEKEAKQRLVESFNRAKERYRSR